MSNTPLDLSCHWSGLLRVVAISMILLSACCLAYAEPTLETTTLDFNAGTALSRMFATLQETFRPKIGPELGTQIVAAFMVLGIVVGAVQVIGGMDFVEAVVRYCKLGALALIALACFQPVSWLEGNSLGMFLREQFIDGGAAMFAESKDPPVYLAYQFMKVFDKAISVNVIPSDLTVWYEKFGFILAHPIATLIALLMVVASAIVLAGVGALVVAEVFLAAISMDLALALTPILVPWVMWRPTSFLFDAWLKTILASGLGFLVASLLGKGSLAFVEVASTLADGLTYGKTYSIASVAAAYGGFFLISLIFAFLASKVIKLAESLIGGGVLSGFSIQAFRNGVGNLNRVAARGGAVARAAGKAGLPVVGAVGGATVGAIQGRRAGTGVRSGAVSGARAGAAVGAKLASKMSSRGR